MNPSPRVPEKPTLDGLEEKWVAVWDAQGTYDFDRQATRENVYSIDTPPPTVSGTLHVGSAYSYTHTDAIARFQRMRGKAVFYPMGWDDNGLPTERRVQNVYGVRCDPSLPYDPDFAPPAKPDKKRQVPISRRNFVALCEELTERDEVEFRKVWEQLGLSVDWKYLYRTIGKEVQATSQRGFLRNLARGEAYQSDAPTTWDVTFQTAVAQAELVEKEQPGAYHRIPFQGPTGPVHIETTRPELIPACVALVAHPDDERYQPLFGQTVRTPLFGVEVPVLAHPLAEPDKGSGIAMICTFGDATDVTWWRELNLPMRVIIERNGRLLQEPPAWLGSETPYGELAGKTVRQAQRRIVELLRESGDLEGEPRPITHPVRFYEKGDLPLEIVTSRQWYIRNGGRDEALRQRLIERGNELIWHPAHMRHRYQNWAEGLSGDWLISRQRFFGVPIPVWYALGADGEPNYDKPIVPDETQLPVDPAGDVPDGYTEDQRGKPGGFIADPDIFDTWATSSLSPQQVSGWERDPELFERVFPMDLRPQAHDIIRTWLFDTVVRAELENDVLPWKHAAISGFVTDPDRKKMGKSDGNAITPLELLKRFGSDGFRYWACSARLGMDSAFDENDPRQLKIGRRLAMKILNASKFAFGAGVTAHVGTISDPLDRALLAELAQVVAFATDRFENYDYAAAMERTEAFFWSLCDDYLELVKSRAYGEHGDAGSARSTLALALSVVLRLFAPVLPYVTEEVWSWWQEGSVHRASWPQESELAEYVATDTEALGAAAAAISAVRKAKSDAKLSMRAEVASLTVTAAEGQLTALQAVVEDLRAAGRIGAVSLQPGEVDEPQYEVAL
ncbi:MAG TPA: valine--tRNA ligase [Mycobacteriales bacterium]|nr:valine--tRNA ligase [Mycobacteriales bacterium]